MSRLADRVSLSRTTRGFSLLEVLVAFVIMGMSLSVLYHALGGSVRAVAASDDRARAAIIAESLFAEFEVVPPEGVFLQGRQGERFLWSVASEPVAAPVEGAAWTLHRLNVEVAWGSEHDERVLRLWSLRPERMTP